MWRRYWVREAYKNIIKVYEDHYQQWKVETEKTQTQITINAWEKKNVAEIITKIPEAKKNLSSGIKTHV